MCPSLLDHLAPANGERQPLIPACVTNTDTLVTHTNQTQARGTIPEPQELSVILIGYLLTVSGWLLVLASLFLLAGLGQRLTFVVAGLLVEILGLTLIALRHRTLQRGPE